MSMAAQGFGHSHQIPAAGRLFPVEIRRHPRARRYVLRVTGEGGLRLTVPRGASIAGGVKFASRQIHWIEREWRRLVLNAAAWETGTAVWYRGSQVRLDVRGNVVTLADQAIQLGNAKSVRAVIEQHLRKMAT